MRSSRQSRTLSLRSLSIVSVALVALLALAVIVALFQSSTLLTRSIRSIEHDTRGVALATQIDRSVREYHRLANLWIAERDPPHDQARSDLETGLRGQLTDARILADGDLEELALVDQMVESVEAYLDRRDALEARGLALDEIVPRVAPDLAVALTSAEALLRHQERQLSDDQAAAAEFARVMVMASSLTGVLLLVSLVAILFGVQRLVLRPLLGVRVAMERFESGDVRARADDEEGSREITDIARTFNSMANTIRQRRQELLTFLAGIAHDLKNPISALKLSWQAMRRMPDALDSEQLERLDRQLDRLTRLIGDLLDAVRIEAGHLELEFEDLDLRFCVREMVELYEPTSPDHTVVLDVPDHPVEIRADPLRVEQVISNLLSNAIKFSPEGGRVDVQVRVAGKMAEVSVTDPGIGIAPEDLPKLFKPFARGAFSKDVSAGAGLGLSVARRIVEAHGGRIDVESTLGEGSTFRVGLPLAPVTVADSADE